jgi:hypothetical protein
MSVITTFYTILGVKLAWDGEDFDYNGVEDEPFILFDAMCGEYMIPGVVLFKGCEGEDEELFAECDIDTFSALEIEYKYRWKLAYPDITLPPFKIISILHYS